jgi:hypothetical protein
MGRVNDGGKTNRAVITRAGIQEDPRIYIN